MPNPRRAHRGGQVRPVPRVRRLRHSADPMPERRHVRNDGGQEQPRPNHQWHDQGHRGRELNHRQVYGRSNFLRHWSVYNDQELRGDDLLPIIRGCGVSNALLLGIGADGILRIPAATVKSSSTDIMLRLIPSQEAWYMFGPVADRPSRSPTAGETIVQMSLLLWTTSATRRRSERTRPPSLPGFRVSWQHPCPQFTVENCTGHQAMTSHSRLGVANARPIGSYAYFDIARFRGARAIPRSKNWGYFDTLKINVTKPTRARCRAPKCLIRLWRFGTTCGRIGSQIQGGSRWSVSAYAGERIITATTVTGAVAADRLMPPGTDQWWTFTRWRPMAIDGGQTWGNTIQNWATKTLPFGPR